MLSFVFLRAGAAGRDAAGDARAAAQVGAWGGPQLDGGGDVRGHNGGHSDHVPAGRLPLRLGLPGRLAGRLLPVRRHRPALDARLGVRRVRVAAHAPLDLRARARVPARRVPPARHEPRAPTAARPPAAHVAALLRHLCRALQLQLGLLLNAHAPPEVHDRRASLRHQRRARSMLIRLSWCALLYC